MRAKLARGTRRTALLLIASCCAISCSSSTAAGPSTAVATTAAPSSTPTVPPSATPAPSPTPSPLATLNVVRFGAADWGPTWKEVSAWNKSREYSTAVGGLNPPKGIYVLNWTEAVSCKGERGMLYSEGEVGSWHWGATERQPVPGMENLPNSGSDLAEITQNVLPYRALAPTTCVPWTLEFRPLGTYFGPNSVQVARLLILSQDEFAGLSTFWQPLDRLEITPEAEGLEASVMHAAERDPNLSAAVQRALSPGWYANSGALSAYAQGHPKFVRFRQLAVLAEVAQSLLSDSQFDLLYGPMADFIGPLSLGLPVGQ